MAAAAARERNCVKSSTREKRKKIVREFKKCTHARRKQVFFAGDDLDPNIRSTDKKK